MPDKKESKTIKMYKGFNKDMTCRDFQFEEGKTYEAEGDVKLCENGFHACTDPIDCFGYYEPGKSVYHEVYMEDVSDEKSDDSKRVAKRITIGAEISLPMIGRLHAEYVKERVTESVKKGDSEQVAVGDKQAATAGDGGSATAGYGGSATAGYGGSATAGNGGVSASRGIASVGEHGVAVVKFNDSPKVKGQMGALLVCAEEVWSQKADAWVIGSYAVGVVDGKNLKPDTWYTVKGGKFVEESKT